MRADRLVAALLLMQARGRVTAAELADEFEVSVATARRDLEALSTAGIPVYPQPGRGGGWQLVGGARTDLSGLSASEAQALFLLLGPAASIAPQAKSALRKLVRALPGTFRADAQAAASAVVVDAAPWGERGRERPAMVDVLQTAVVRRRKVRLVYADRARARTQRLVDPWGLADKDDVWYLVAGTENGQRTFRVDRIVEAVMTDLDADRPAEFELSEEWARIVDEVEQRRSLVSATVLIDAKLVPGLRTQFGRHCDVDGALDDGRVRVRLAAPMAVDRGATGRVGCARRGRGTRSGPCPARADRRGARRSVRDLRRQRQTLPTRRLSLRAAGSRVVGRLGHGGSAVAGGWWCAGQPLGRSRAPPRDRRPSPAGARGPRAAGGPRRSACRLGAFRTGRAPRAGRGPWRPRRHGSAPPRGCRRSASAVRTAP